MPQNVSEWDFNFPRNNSEHPARRCIGKLQASNENRINRQLNVSSTDRNRSANSRHANLSEIFHYLRPSFINHILDVSCCIGRHNWQGKVRPGRPAETVSGGLVRYPKDTNFNNKIACPLRINLFLMGLLFLGCTRETIKECAICFEFICHGSCLLMLLHHLISLVAVGRVI